jgi:hypothetical protein
VAAIETARSGKVLGKPLGGGKARYQVGEISFLLRASGKE